jgi:esterase FrsA
MQRLHRSGAVALIVLLGLLAAAPFAQERSLDEVKRDIRRRVEQRQPPFDDVRADEVERVLSSLTSLDKDEWGTRWCNVGLDHERRGDALLARGAPAKEIGEAYYLAYSYCHIGRYPVPSSPAKQDAYTATRRTFLKAATYFDTPLQLLEIPFEGKALKAYLQVPRGASRPPVVMYWGGVDVWKEDHQRNSGMMHRRGLATLLVDPPGAGESPVRFTERDAERMFSAVMDHLATRSDVDGTRVAAWGRSFGAYWAAKLAYVEAKRLKGAVFHGGNAHFGFQEEWLRPALTKTASNYLLGPSSLFDSRSFVLGVKALDDVFRIAPTFSLKDLGLLDKPSAPMLIVNGKLDDQAPIADSYLLLEHGSPKEARIYPQGGHMGAAPGVNPDVIANVIVDWLAARLAQQASAPPPVPPVAAALAPAVPVVKPVADGVYIFEYRGYQSMFVVDPEGVVATDPMNTEAAKVYLAEIRKITSAPIRYVVYSHHHYDHIAGGAPFKQAGAVFVAHRNARPQLERLKNPGVVLPDQVVGDRQVLKVGRTTVELHYMGRNHSDNSLVISVPAQKVIYAADWLPLGELIWRNVFDSYIDEWFEGVDRVLALDWDRLVVGHARAHNPKGWGTKDDVRAFKRYFTDLKEAVRVAYAAGLCPDRAPSEVKLPQYAHLFQYNAFLPMNVDRMCLYGATDGSKNRPVTPVRFPALLR